MEDVKDLINIKEVLSELNNQPENTYSDEALYYEENYDFNF